jgi:hypothetical protein
MFSLMILSILVTALVPAPPYDPDKLPYRGTWGPYTITVEKTGTEEFAPQRLRILDSQGQVVREIRDQRIMAVLFPKLFPGDEDLRVSTFSGGAHCCSTDYFFTQRDGVRNLLIFDGVNGGINAVKDLNGDGIPEILAGSDVLAYFDDLPYAASPGMVMIVGWDGQRYVDQTAKYPQRSRAMARDAQRELLANVRAKGTLGEEMRRSAAAGYYANSLVVGEGPAAWKWLLAHAPASTRRWLIAEQAAMRTAALSGKGKLRVSQDKVLEGKQP